MRLQVRALLFSNMLDVLMEDSVLYFIALVGALIYSGVCSSRWQPTQLQGAEAPARPTQQQQIEAPAHPTKEEEIEVPAKS